MVDKFKKLNHRECLMKLLNVFLILSLVFFVSCSNNKKKSSKASGDEIVMDDADFIIDEGGDDLVVDEPKEEVAISDMPSGSDDIQISSSATPSVGMTEEVADYVVQKGDTLMLVAFKLYGDYSQWKSIVSLNPGVRSNNLSDGQVLKHYKPAEEFVWNPQGLPHLIRNGETLVTISKDKYNTVNRWKDLYNNNRPMIKDPNLIFAGFTLYYVPDRDLASE